MQTFVSCLWELLIPLPVAYREFAQGSAIAVLDLSVIYVGKSIKTTGVVSANAHLSLLYSVWCFSSEQEDGTVVLACDHCDCPRQGLAVLDVTSQCTQ